MIRLTLLSYTRIPKAPYFQNIVSNLQRESHPKVSLFKPYLYLVEKPRSSIFFMLNKNNLD